MKLKTVVIVLVTVLICVFLISIPAASSSPLNIEPQTTTAPSQQIEDQIKQAVLSAVAANERYQKGELVINLQVTDIKVSSDLLWATAWVVYYDPQIEAIIPTEPALAVAQLVRDQWQVFLPSDSGWQDAINQLPDDLMARAEKEMWLAMVQGEQLSLPTQSGYLLPWHGGETGYLSRSVGHDADYNTSHYAFDFYFPGNTICPGGGAEGSGTTGQNFKIYASRAATVWGWDDSFEDCDHSGVNFIVLRNVDDPSIFQLYMHLSQDSIPPQLKSVGTPVARGQFIALADNTGNSTGSHLHFQIEHQPYWPVENPYWNTSLDMTFDDVDINQGYPRVNPLDGPYCHDDDICDVFRADYLSGNYFMGDSTPPIGDLSGVDTGDVIVDRSLYLAGWGSDAGSGLDYGQMMAFFDGSWHSIGPQFNPNFTYTWDLCDPALQVGDGPVSVALLLYDKAGNPAPLVGLRHITKDYSCPVPPTECYPGDNQVTLFEDPYYQGGCVKFNIGNYPTGSSLNPLGDNDADSLMIGAGVIATLYSEESFTGHSQAFTQTIPYLQYQWVYPNITSSMKVTSRQVIPQAPNPIYPITPATFREDDNIPFSWLNGGGGTEFQLELYKDSNYLKTIPWQSDLFAYIDSLGEGSYSWRVQARNIAGLSAWSGYKTFTIESSIIYPPLETVPYSDTMEDSESEWIGDGLWSYMDDPANAHSGTHSWWYQTEYGDYDTGFANTGSLTSPPVNIDAPGYYLRFYYRYETETQGNTWDQRWVQVSVDRGPFVNLFQLSDDPRLSETVVWLQNKAYDLSAYVGNTIRIRFQFSTLDAAENGLAGWGIDDFSITADPPSACSDDRQDETPQQAFLLTYDSSFTMPGAICPNGDFDFYKFYGQAGDHIVADIDAMVNGSLLDSYLYLLDTDGKTVLAENDDQVYAELRDSLINYILPKDGTYFLKLKAWKHPLVGGDDYFYTIRLYEDHVSPVATITWPSSDIFLPDTDMTITASVDDIANGIDRVDFYWHSVSWQPGAWVKFGTDRDGSDGWSMPFSPAGQPEGLNAAFYIQVYDLAGNWAGAGAWNLGRDKTAPVTALDTLASTQLSNAFRLDWSGYDNLSGIDFIEIQEKINDGSWTTYPPIDGSLSQYWVIAEPGFNYAYRMHAVDFSGNSETYPANAETSTAVPDKDTLCYLLDSYDTSGNDNSPDRASIIYPNGASQFHNFCNPNSNDYQNDEDWVQFTPVLGKYYFIHSIATSQPTATILSLYALDGRTLLAEVSPREFGASTYLIWKADRSEPVYIRLLHQDGRVIGSNVGSNLSVQSGTLTFLPLLNR